MMVLNLVTLKLEKILKCIQNPRATLQSPSYTINPAIKGISGDEEGAVTFLEKIGYLIWN